MDTLTFDNAFIELRSDTRMDEIGFDETNPEHIIVVLKEVLLMLKEDNEKKEKLCVECKKMWGS